MVDVRSDPDKLDAGEPRANELRCEDEGGREEVLLRAERDMNVRVRHDETHHVGHDQFNKIGRNRQEIVRVDEKIDVGRSRTGSLGNDESVTIKQDQELKVGNARTTEVKANGERTGFKSLKIESYQSIELIVGGSSIKLDPGGIMIKAMTIKVASDLTTETKALMTTIKASATMIIKGGITFIN